MFWVAVTAAPLDLLDHLVAAWELSGQMGETSQVAKHNGVWMESGRPLRRSAAAMVE